MNGFVEVLPDETRSAFGIDVTELPKGSHAQVVVRCKECKETFAREFRSLSHPHACPTHVLATKTKWCPTCFREEFLPGGLFRDVSEFEQRPDNFDGLSSICKRCLIQLDDNWKENDYGWVFNADELRQAVDDQQGRCWNSQEPLRLYPFTVNDPKHPHLNFIRLDESKPYKYGNVALSNRVRFSNFKAPKRLRLETKRLDPAAELPFRKRTTDAGYDIYSLEEKIVPAQGFATVKTGIAISPPEGYYFTVEGRSSLGLLGITPIRGIIDGTYQGELNITLVNRSTSDYHIKSKERVAQIILHEILHADFAVIEEFSPVVDGRRGDGFGSSGK